MFDDIVCPKTNNKKMYICAFAVTCDSKYCLHKLPHKKNGLGREQQPEDDTPCDCTVTPCEYLGINALCIEIE